MKWSVLFLLILLSCSGSKKNEIPLFNNQTFKLVEGENLSTADSVTQKLYKESFTHGNVQVPLFKYIRHNDYKLFIGLPLKTSVDELAESKFDESSYQKGSKDFYKKSINDNYKLIEFATSLDSDNLIYISVITESDKLVDSLFTKDNLSSRIIKN